MIDKIILRYMDSLGTDNYHEVEGEKLYPIYKLLEELLWRLTEKERDKAK